MTTILVVDGDATARRTTQYMLQTANYTVAPACDVHQANMQLMRMQSDLLITELSSARFDGFAFLRALRASEHYHALPVIVLTSSAHKRDHRRALQLGAVLCLAKPVQSDMLVGVVNRVLQQRAIILQVANNLSRGQVPELLEGVPLGIAV
ncbi:MAG TPA: response regulator [Roseiflexaceae bacterium]|jgi:two-component system chemotaxis response regulator CheY|nr:response regulator [Roseiflexaceae bacterium]